MRQYATPSTIGKALGYPPDGKRFGRVLVEVGLRDRTGQPTRDAQARGIAKKRGARRRWEFDVEAATVRVKGGSCLPEIAVESESIGMELAAIDAVFTSRMRRPELVELGHRWDQAMRQVTPHHVQRINGVLRREGAPFRLSKNGEVELLQGREKDAIA